MNSKRVICIIICLTILLCCVSCKKSNTSSGSSYTSQIYEEVTIIENDNSSLQSVISQPSSTNNITSESSTVSSRYEHGYTDDTIGDEMYKFNFNNIESVDYFCVKNIPNSDIIYAVTNITADTKQDILIGCKLFCNDPLVKINNMVITIPFTYKQQQKPVTITAKYSFTGQSYDFKIKYQDSWDLVFEDEFNGTQIDLTKWEYRPDHFRDKGYINYWDKSTMFVDNKGNLVSRARPGKKIVNGKMIDAYLSGAISTKGLFESTYGYYEASVKLHHQTGMWGAFWMICGDMDTDAVPDNSSVNGCEIDIFESLYNHGGVCQNLHWDGFRGNTGSLISNGYITYIDTYDNDYHTFALSWTPNEYVFLVDGIVTRRTTANGVCNQPGYMIISTECGVWAGDWVLDEGEYSDMLVDYVKVYQSPNGYN